MEEARGNQNANSLLRSRRRRVTHLPQIRWDRKGNLVPRQHTDCLNSINKLWTLYRRDLCPLVIRARSTKGLAVIRALNSDKGKQIVCLLKYKESLLAKFFVWHCIVFIARSHIPSFYSIQRISRYIT